MTTLKITAGTAEAIETTTPTVPEVDNATLITEQQVLFGSAAALAPAPHKHHHMHDLASAVRAMFVGQERRHVRRHYPQRLGYLDSSLMSREMDRL
jgi:hypothetical protein